MKKSDAEFTNARVRTRLQKMNPWQSYQRQSNFIVAVQRAANRIRTIRIMIRPSQIALVIGSNR